MIAGRGAAVAGVAAARRRAAEQALAEEELRGEEESDEGESSSEADEGDAWPRRLAKSPAFSLAANAVILLNLGSMWLQADFPEWDFWAANSLFLLFFVAELALRLLACGCRGFFGDPDDRGWNVFDFAVVLLGAADWVSRLPGELCDRADVACELRVERSSGTQFVTVVRVLRIFRVLRVLRVFKFARPLTQLAQGLLDSVATVFYIVLFISVVILLYSIACTQTIGHHAHLWEAVGEDPEEIRRLFGSMGNSSLTLFQFLTLDDWSNITRTIGKVWWPFYFFFIFYVLVTAFVILSLLTGTMAERMAAVRLDDGRDITTQRRKEKDVYKAFKELDVSNSDFLTMSEFASLHDYPDMEEDLKVVLSGLEPADLFQCFDTDGDGRLDWFEFKDGMMELRKGISKKQYFKLQAMMQRVVEQSPERCDRRQAMSAEVASAIEDVGGRIEECDDLLSGLAEQMDLALKRIRELRRGS